MIENSSEAGRGLSPVLSRHARSLLAGNFLQNKKTEGDRGGLDSLLLEGRYSRD